VLETFGKVSFSASTISQIDITKVGYFMVIMLCSVWHTFKAHFVTVRP